MKVKGRGYPIPPKRLSSVIWVNDTPHLSVQAAADHRTCLAMGRVNYSTFIDLLDKFLMSKLVNPKHRKWNANIHYMAAHDGPIALKRILERAYADGEKTQYMLDKLLEDKLDKVEDPILGPTYNEDLQSLFRALASLPDSELKKYELKLFRKYAGDSSVRTGEGYIKQVRDNYLPSRKAWRETKMPDMEVYERAYHLYRTVTALSPTYDGSFDDTIIGFLDRARKNTFGGEPYNKNMGDFVSEDESDNTTYVDWYNKLAILWLYLPPAMKISLNPEFKALERVQPGGFEELAPDGDLLDKIMNKQRFVQAQSAMVSHGTKFLVDGLNSYHKRTRPAMYADKYGEEMVTAEMKRLVTINFGLKVLSADTVSKIFNLVGTDYTNFDASQDITIANDVHYNNWRFISPAWMTYYIIDPYVKMTYRDNRILVPKFGLIQTTGVKSGMGDTNQTDTDDCGFADIYEPCWYSKHHRYLSDEDIMQLAGYTLDNGDDRCKLTYCSADDIEKADGELGYIAQKQKQEVYPAGTKARDLGVTYLKTIVALVDGQLVRTDAVSKLILARVHPESRPLISKPASTVMDFIMSASRSYESPNLWILVDYMYARLDMFRKLVKHEISLKQLIDTMVAEQMSELLLTKGKKWVKRKGMNADMIIERMNTKYGYGDEGYRGNVGALKTEEPDKGLAALPQYKSIMGIASERYITGELGGTFNGKN